MKPIIDIHNLKISYKTGTGPKQVVKGVSFSLGERELLALVGGSGCGKTTICKAMAGLMNGGTVIDGTIKKEDDPCVAMVFQDPYLSLDPSQKVGKQVEETILLHIKRHSRNNKEFAKIKALELLDMVGIQDAEKRYDDIPQSFSGGMRQRIAIAIALAMEPDVIIADELTSSLDEENTNQIINLLNSLRDRLGTAIILVTHDLSIVENHCDRVLIMKDGNIVEEGKAENIFSAPQNEYTKNLLRYAHYGKGTEHTHGDLHFHDGLPHSHKYETSKENHTHDKVVPSITRDERLGHVPHIIEIKDLSKSYKINRQNKIKVFDNINLNIHKGELLGLSGKSGIGKTTLAKCIAGIELPDSGSIKYGSELQSRHSIQMIFQDSKSALNPRMTVRQQIEEAINLSPHKKNSTIDLLNMVELDESLLPKRPYEISGGQRQRVAIARALAMNPNFLIADEPISSLDMAVQAQMIHLIKQIQEINNLTVLLISHDIPMLIHVCDRIISLD